MNATGNGLMFYTSPNNTQPDLHLTCTLGQLQMTPDNKLVFANSSDILYRVMRVAKYYNYLEFISTDKTKISKNEYDAGRPVPLDEAEEQTMNNIDFAINEPQKANWILQSFFVGNKVINIGHLFVYEYNFDKDSKAPLMISVQRFKQFHKFFVCQSTFANPAMKSKHLIMIEN